MVDWRLRVMGLLAGALALAVPSSASGAVGAVTATSGTRVTLRNRPAGPARRGGAGELPSGKRLARTILGGGPVVANDHVRRAKRPPPRVDTVGGRHSPLWLPVASSQIRASRYAS